MEWLEGERTSATDRTLGRNLAKLHQTLGPMHGFETDGYIGILNQPNKLEPNWLAYFREYRLKYHVKYAIDKGMLLGKRKTKFLKLLDQLENWIPRFVEPSRSEEHTSELQSRGHLVCRLLLEKKKQDLQLMA